VTTPVFVGAFEIERANAIRQTLDAAFVTRVAATGIFRGTVAVNHAHLTFEMLLSGTARLTFVAAAFLIWRALVGVTASTGQIGWSIVVAGVVRASGRVLGAVRSGVTRFANGFTVTTAAHRASITSEDGLAARFRADRNWAATIVLDTGEPVASETSAVEACHAFSIGAFLRHAVC